MTDIALVYDPATGTADLAIENGDLVMDDGLDTAALISLFTDRRADADDPVDPRSPTGGRRGWPGDLVAPPGDRIGSRLWLILNGKIVQGIPGQSDTTSLVEQDVLECFQWAIDDGVATSVTCTAQRIGLEAIGAEVAMFKGTNPIGRWKYVWQAQAAKGG